MMKVYIVIWSDRHSDTSAHPFTNPDKAVAEARSIAMEYARTPEDYSEKDYDGWLFYAEYSCEGDHVRVVETTMNEELECLQ